MYNNRNYYYELIILNYNYNKSLDSKDEYDKLIFIEKSNTFYRPSVDILNNRIY